MGALFLETFILGPIENNNYLLVDEENKDAVLIDCTEDSDEIHNAIKKYDAKLKYILLTHGHFDHVLGVNAFRAKYPDCKVLLHESDKELMQGISSFALKFGLPAVEVQKVDEYLKDGDIIKFGNNEIKVIHTPGHTKGGVCYLVEDKLFSGDTLFFQSVGRTDLPDGHFGQLKSSISEKLFTLDDNINVYPGHGPTTSIGHEKVNNQFI